MLIPEAMGMGNCDWPGLLCVPIPVATGLYPVIGNSSVPHGVEEEQFLEEGEC